MYKYIHIQCMYMYVLKTFLSTHVHYTIESCVHCLDYMYIVFAWITCTNVHVHVYCVHVYCIFINLHLRVMVLTEQL